jgi:ABC-type siderophore export system fused ATPase/permease subunit
MRIGPLQAKFSVVFSDFYLFEELLGFDNPNLDRQAQEYLVKLHLDKKVMLTASSPRSIFRVANVSGWLS